MTDPAAPSDAVRAALERLVAAFEAPISLPGTQGNLDDALANARAALRLPAAAPVDVEKAYQLLTVIASSEPPVRCTTHHGCRCREWSNEQRVLFRDAARSLLPVDAWHSRLAGQSSSQPVGGEK